MLGGFIQKAFDWFDASPVHPSEGENANTRSIVLANQAIHYRFERSKRRTIGFVVDPHGLAVRAPRWTPITEVESAIREKSTWILKKLVETHERQAHSLQAEVVWAQGASIDYLGQPLSIQLNALTTSIDPQQARIWVALPTNATEAQIADAVQSAMQRAALLFFETRLNFYAPQLNVTWTKLKLSNAGGRWGSAKSDGTIRLNWRLMHFRLPVIDYVVVHELSHLRHMDHSPRFWETVESIVPNYAKLKKELKPI